MGDSSNKVGAWVAGIAATVIGGIVLAIVTPMVTGGSSNKTSGPASMGPLEIGINRQGYDYDAYGKTANNAQLCAEMCRADAQCKAMTYVLTMKRCWLKTGVPPASSSPVMISSVKVGL